MYQIANTGSDSLSELHLNYDGTRVFALVSRLVSSSGSNFTKMYATADGFGILLSNEKYSSYRAFYLQPQGLWYLISQTNSKQLNWYRESNLANLTMAPYTVTNVLCKPFSSLQLTIKALIYKIASNGNDVIAASIAYNTSSITPSIFIHNTSNSLLLTIVTYIHSCHTTPCSHNLYH